MQRANPHPARNAFTLIELIAVLVLVSVLSLTAIPATHSIGLTRSNALQREVLRRIDRARAHAMSTGLSAGVQFNLKTQHVNLRVIPAQGLPPSNIPPLQGITKTEVSLSGLFPGASITAADLDDSSTYDTLWFDYKGTPHYRQTDGTFVANLTRDAIISINNKLKLTIHPSTGLVER